MPQNNSTRNSIADFLKGVAVLLMVQVHVMEQFASPALYQSLLGKASLFLGGPACAPIFLVVMAYFMARADAKPSILIRRGIKLFILGIGLNVARSTNLLIQIYKGNYFLEPLNFIFGADILTLAGLACILMAFLSQLLKKNYLVYFLLAIVVALLSDYCRGFSEEVTGAVYLKAFFAGNAQWSYFPVFPWLSYVLVGYAFYFLPEKIYGNSKLIKTILSVSIAAIFIFSSFAVGVATDLTSSLGYYYHNLWFFLWVLAFIMVYSKLAEWICHQFTSNYFFQKILFLGKNVTIVYVIQWIIIGNIATEIYQTQEVVGFWIWTILVILLSYAGTRMYLSWKQSRLFLFFHRG